ncbi:MAG: type I-C CRISPR-associated protein Cas8c/Csd1 [Lachnospiraceae bacterium]|nr:type I-C CRISPR-associated protein Cas8c/Csd1 [Lachnospiraceae bacterium]
MGLFQNAVETYDAMKELAGVAISERKALAPVGHMTTKAKIEITIDEVGDFVRAQKVDSVILFPATEESSGRTSAPVAHPLCDQLGYITPYDSEKNDLYIKQLTDWVSSPFIHKKAAAVLQYLCKGTIVSDLEKADLIQLDEKGNLKNEKDFVCWRVLTDDGTKTAVWEDRSLMQSFTSYYLTKKESETQEICMISGDKTSVTTQHLKGVVPANGNAKLISSNDSTNYTYRGRFLDEKEAISVGYETSQKAHNALKWLVANDGVSLGGGRTLICWNPQGKVIPSPHSSLRKRNEERIVPSAYKAELHRIIWGYKKDFSPSDKAVMAVFDAATTGRLCVAYYNEFNAADFMDRLQYWDETCCWFDNRWGVESPSLFDLAKYAFGTGRGGQMDVDDKVKAQQMQRLISCRIDKQAFPLDIMRRLVMKADNLQMYEGVLRDRLLFITCAGIKKYKWDQKKEDCKMALEPGKKDRSYQYGRLLAVMEKAEHDTYENGEKRETNAIRLQMVFVKRPAYATNLIMNQLKQAYYPQLQPGARVKYEKLIGEIMGVLSEFGEDQYNKPLEETYLLGYYLQKNDLYSKKDNKEEE